MPGANKIVVLDKRVNVAVTQGSAPAVVVTSSTLSAKIVVSSVGVGGITTLAGLSDTTIITPIEGHTLIYSGGTWTNNTDYILGSLSFHSTSLKSLGTSVFPWSTVFASFIDTGSNTTLQLTSRETDAAFAEGFVFSTLNTLSDGSDRWLASFVNGGDYKLTIGTQGEFVWWDSTKGGDFKTWISDTPSAVAYTFNTANSLTISGTKLLSLQNNSVELLSVDKNGQLKQVINSPNDFVQWIENTNAGTAFGMVCRVSSSGNGYAAQFQNLVGLDDDLQIFIAKSDRMIQCRLGVNDVFVISKDGLVTSVGDYLSSVADGIGAVAFSFDTANAITTGNLFEIKNNGTSNFTIDGSGNIVLSMGTIKQTLAIKQPSDKYFTLDVTSVGIFDGVLFDNLGLAGSVIFRDTGSNSIQLTTGGITTTGNFAVGTNGFVGCIQVSETEVTGRGGNVSDLGSASINWKDFYLIGDYNHKATTGAKFNSDVVDGVSSIAFEFDTTNNLSIATSKLLSLKNFGAERFSVENNGDVLMTSAANFYKTGDFDSFEYNAGINQLLTFPGLGLFLSVNSLKAMAFANTGASLQLSIQNGATYSSGGIQMDLGTSFNHWKDFYIDGTIKHKSTANGALFSTDVSNLASSTAYEFDTTNSLIASGAKLLSLKNATVEKFSVDKDGKLFLTDATLLGTKVNGAIEYSDGHLYFTHGDRFVFVGSNAVKTSTTTVTNTVVETTIFSHTFSANALHADEIIVAAITGALTTASGSESLTMNFKLAGTTVHTVTFTPGNGTDIGWKAIHKGTIRTDGATGTFIDFSEYSESGKSSLYQAETTTHSINTTVSNLYEITITWGTAKAGNSFSCTQGDLTYKH